MADGLPDGPARHAQPKAGAEARGPCVDSQEVAAALAAIASRQLPQFDRLIDDADPCSVRWTHRPLSCGVVSAAPAQGRI